MNLANNGEFDFYQHSTLEKHQALMLRILSEFEEICSLNDIDYWIDGGTALGLERHNSLIPWDDDIDICMPISDYDKFISIIKSKMGNSDYNYFLYYEFTGLKNWCEYFCIKEYFYTRRDGFLKPVKIDIFPVKHIARDELSADRNKVEEVANYIKSGKKSLYENIANYPRFLNEKKSIMCKYYDYMRKSTGDCNGYLVKGHGQYSPIQYVEYSIVYPLKSRMLHGINVGVPNDLISYLDKSYGRNFNKLPNIEKRKPMNLGVIKIKEERKSEKVLKYFANAEDKLFLLKYNKIISIYKLYKVLRFSGFLSVIRLIKERKKI